MYIKNHFKIIFFVMILLLFINCNYRERLNPKDPLSPDYQQPYRNVVITSNININYTNATIIDKDTTWSMPKIKILQNVLITKGATLTILPPTVVEFYAVGTGSVGIIIDDGALKAVGTRFSPVKFTAIDFAFAYVVFRNNSVFYNSILQYCDLRSTLLYFIHNDPTLPNNNISVCNNKISDMELFAFPVMNIKYNDIEFLKCDSSAPVIKHNLFYYSAGRNDCIIIKGNQQPMISSNNIYGGANYRIKLDSTSLPQNAMDNYWGLSIAGDIEVKIWDKIDDSALGTVIYNPFYTNSISGAGAGAAW